MQKYCNHTKNSSPNLCKILGRKNFGPTNRFLNRAGTVERQTAQEEGHNNGGKDRPPQDSICWDWFPFGRS
jgi:hypothetical protein